MTRVRKAKFIGADATMSCPAGIPIDLHAHSVSIRTAPAAHLVLDPLEKSPPPSGIRFQYMIVVLFCFNCYFYLDLLHLYFAMLVLII